MRRRPRGRWPPALQAGLAALALACGATDRRAAIGVPDSGSAGGDLSALGPLMVDSIPPVAAPALTAEQRRGQALYSTFCSTCHGLYGHGDGPGARGFREPLPDLERVAAAQTVDRIVARFLSEQRANGAPAPEAVWHALDSAQLRSAGAYIKSFAPPGERGNPAAGRLLYASYCVLCHGTRGDGKGRLAHLLARQPADLRLVDATDRPERVFAAIKSGGRSPHGGYMTRWGQALSDEELWDLVAYLAVLHSNRGPRG